MTRKYSLSRRENIRVIRIGKQLYGYTPMRLIPKKLRDEIALDPYYQTCCRKNRECAGRITWEHAFIYGGKQINEKWAILPLCIYHHLGEGLKKRLNERIAVARATPEELAKYPRRDWNQYKK